MKIKKEDILRIVDFALIGVNECKEHTTCMVTKESRLYDIAYFNKVRKKVESSDIIEFIG